MENENGILEVLRRRKVNKVGEHRQRLKRLLVDYKGGKCSICGYDKCINALEFHHLNPAEKDFSISRYNKLSFEDCKKEADKCILVCSNCHKELHYYDNIRKRKEMEEKEIEVYTHFINNRHECDDISHMPDIMANLERSDILKDIENEMDRNDILKKYRICNRTFNKFLSLHNITYSKKKIVEDKPNKEELIELLKTNSKSSVGRMFGVSCGAVMKWCKKYGIQSARNSAR